MTLTRAFAGIVATLALPMLVSAQAGGGVCLFSGNLSFHSAIGVVPNVCQSPAGCDRFSLNGALSGPTCPGFDGLVSTRRGLVFGAYGCAGNIHGGVLDHGRFAGSPFSFYGVCVGGACSGGGYATFGAIQYDVLVDPGSAAAVTNQCASGTLRNLPMVGTMAGGAVN